MAGDTAVLAALVIAVVALVVASAQLTQQLLATAYTLRKCDGIVTGGLIKGGTRKWHWRQFRFSVEYRSILFSLPASIYRTLGISPTVRIDTPSKKLWMKALKLRDCRYDSTQGCSISFVQDLVMFHCISEDDISVKQESGDRIPDDLTVAPTRMDAMSVMLTCVAMGMQVFRYSPTTGEITLGGGVGGISSSAHPILGCLLHYSVFTNEPSIGLEITRRHGRALRHAKGVWANAVFGKFRNRWISPEFVKLEYLRAQYLPILRTQGWPEGSITDTIGGAACFMAFAYVDDKVYEAAPPSVVRPCCAHFAETIVKSHHLNLRQKELEAETASRYWAESFASKQSFIEALGCSSPHLQWENVNEQPETDPASPLDEDVLQRVETIDSFVVNYLFADQPFSTLRSILLSNRDPSDYVPMDTAWKIIVLIDQCMRHISFRCRYDNVRFMRCVGQTIATAISPLSETGAPSWGLPHEGFDSYWSETFPAACNKVMGSQNELEPRSEPCDRWIPIFARLAILRAAYYTIMMRAAPDIGPGLTEGGRIDTALVYMA